MKSVLLPLASALRSGEITSVSLTEKYIARIEEKNPQINAFIHNCFDYALESAERADKLIKGGNAPILAGIPFGIKDNICTKGLPTTCCSRILENFKPIYDAAAWEKLKAAGAVLLGKTNMDEFAMGSTGERSVYGPCVNPLNGEKVTGGSSGGSAAAVCARMAPYAIGSDTGGSVRQPASFCGVVGFKPSYGAVSRYGLIAYGSSLDCIGTLTSSVSDAAIVFDGIRGRDDRDRTSIPSPTGKKELKGDIKGLKIGVAEELFEGCSSEVADAVKEAVKLYESAGAKIIKMSIPALTLALPAYYIIACAEASSNLGRYDGIRYGYRASGYSGVDDMVIKTRSQGFGDEVKKRIMLGTYVLSSGYFDAYYKKACIVRNNIKAELEKVFGQCDVLFAPTAPKTAFPRGYASTNPLETYSADMCTVPVNIAGLSAISIPCGADKEGMPIGLQIIGARGADLTVLDCAYFAERENAFAHCDKGEDDYEL